MLPKIENGDKILIQKQTTVDNGAVAVVLINNEDAVVKRVFYGPDWVELRSFNSDYPIRKFTGSDVQQITIIGKVKEVSKRFD